ncbi:MULTISPECIES: OmpA family protein [Campylobacter]|uniref:OmpA family protein n=1 Tax=Campylobacter californiensis TaxID=1032243 RepID=A0ABD4JHH8_9BACT|nr:MULTISPECIES: OmpA family protein [unclassified Campylobacter]MBE2985852.1 OmpA family protein [Campylobacter sp. RM12919]MBE2987967.1 OmpA family protein [Campylobacter sp. RM12920]MBE3609539.1 OmpA family protein [Campylobacter sp. RM12916]
MKKIALAMVAATALFASNSAYNYEVTPTIGGVHSEGNLGYKNDQVNVGIKAARNLEGLFFDQFELGVDYTHRLKETVKGVTRTGHATRYTANLVKDIFDFTDNFGLYGLVGLGYEDLSSKFVDNEDGGFGQYGLGLRYQVTDVFALKAEVRDAIKFEHADHNLFYTLGFGIGLDAKNVAPVVAAAPAMAPAAPVSLDDDNDGVLNDVDKCPNTPAGVVVDETGCEKVIVLRDLGVNFAFDSYAVSPTYAAEIKKVADFMAENPDYKVVLAGHTDSVGKEAYNQKLSEKRANAVAKTLEGYGVSADKISTLGYGELRPIADNGTKEGRAQNRRVEATFNK